MSSNTDRLQPQAAIREAASFIRLIGGVGRVHLTVMGGLGPALLVPAAASTHAGTSDLDLCMSVALADGHTNQYYRSLQDLIAPFFEPAGATFRWRKRRGVPGHPLVVDFLAPESEQDPGHAGQRPLRDPNAADNAGALLRPFPLRAGALISADGIEGAYDDVPLLYQPGQPLADVSMRHAGPVGFLAAKADALEGRSEGKDGYDVSWWCLNAAATPEDVAAQVTARPSFKDPLFIESVAQIIKAFKTPDHHGPVGYADLMHPPMGRDQAAYDQARNIAFARTSSVFNILKAELFSVS